jgi:CRISPR system Cascade subunit CasE
MPETIHYLSRVPLEAIGVFEAEDRNAVHKAIMRLFPGDLPGAANERRAASQILFRIEESRGENVALISSVSPPTSDVPGILTKRFNPTLEAGIDVRLKIDVNPVLRRTETDATGRKKISTRAVAPEQFGAWFNARLGTAFTNVEIISYDRQIGSADRTANTNAQRATDRHKHAIVIDTIEAIATVNNVAAVRELMFTGVGRSKAFGCGLLSVAS